MQDVKKSREAEEIHEFNEERMLMETTDYPPTGPDPKHDPHAPPPPQPWQEQAYNSKLSYVI